MSTETVSQGNPFTVRYKDRTANSGPAVDVFVADETGNVKVGGRSILGDPGVSSTTGTASNTATLQLKDAAGNAHAGVRRVYFWVSATAGATSVGTGTSGLTTTVTTGVAITAVAGNLAGDCLTDASGKLVVTLADASGAETRYVNFLVDGKVFSTGAIVAPA